MSASFIQFYDAFFWAILVLGALALLMALERFFTLQRYRIDVDDFISGIKNNLDRGGDESINANEATTLCDDTPGPVPQIVAKAIRHRGVPRADMVMLLHGEGLSQISRMERRLSFLALTAQIAPVLGLLGTVFTLVRIVQSASQSSQLFLTADLLTAITPALYNTAAGLGVAISAYTAFNLLVLKIDRLVLDMENAANQIVSYFDNRQRIDSRQRTLGI